MAKKNELVKKVNLEVDGNRDDLISDVANMLNKESKDSGKVAFFLNDDDVTNIPDWISTGVDELDFKISNRKNGGVPSSKITEFLSWEGVGKSLLSSNLIASTQKKGGVAILIDTENAASKDFLKVIGVDIDKLIYVKLRSLEDIFEYIEKIVLKIRESDKSRLVTIIVDSLTAAITKDALEADYEQSGYGTAKAKLMSESLPKINDLIAKRNVCLVFNSQLREKIGVVGFGAEKSQTSGGKALPFYASVRVRLKSLGKIKDKSIDEVVGVKTEATVIKNRMGPPHRKCEFMIYFESGTDNYESWLEILKDNKIISGAKSPFKYTTDSGEEIQITRQSIRTILRENGKLKEELYEKISKFLIKEYNPDTDLDVEVSGNDDSETPEVSLE